MTPYYKDDFVTIYHGDCMEIMPKLGRFDLLVTDPPYGMNYVSSRRKVRHEAIVGDDRLPVEELVEIMKCVDRASYHDRKSCKGFGAKMCAYRKRRTVLRSFCQQDVTGSVAIGLLSITKGTRTR